MDEYVHYGNFYCEVPAQDRSWLVFCILFQYYSTFSFLTYNCPVNVICITVKYLVHVRSVQYYVLVDGSNALKATRLQKRPCNVSSKSLFRRGKLALSKILQARVHGVFSLSLELRTQISNLFFTLLSFFKKWILFFDRLVGQKSERNF